LIAAFQRHESYKTGKTCSMQNALCRWSYYCTELKHEDGRYFFWRVVVTDVYDMLGLKVDCGGGGGTPNGGGAIPAKSCWPFGGAPG
jgi:hypothetical protein